jgi:FecR protein
MRGAIDRLVRESRPELGTRQARDVDWAKVDRGLFDRIAAEQRAERAELKAGPGRVLALATAGLAVAAGAALFVGKAHELRTLVPVQAVGETEAAGSVVGIEGDGQLVIDGKPGVVGAELRLGDVLETHGAVATIERPGRLTVVLEEGGRATVSHVQGALVLALERGAVEAQVVPVVSGEAFAVDVGTSRVAVHGTHLRVGRTGEHVVVDLNEGVVSLGPAPRIGSTLGALVTAPAHAEFNAGDAESTLVVSHDPAAVRAPASLGSSAQTRASRPAPAAAPARVEPTDARQPAQDRGAITRADVKAPTAPPGQRPASAVEPEPDPESSIAAAVRSCLTSRPRADNVTVMVSTTVRIELTADGTVQSARFDPPVAPDVNGCASGAIYRTHFSHGGSVAVPVDVKVPSSAP